jgi:N-acetyl-S-(2-succino)cysteine monooxygenase
MTRMHLMWFCAFSPHAGFGLDGWAGPRTTGYEWTRPELWQDMAVALERAKFDLIMLGDSLAVPGTYQGRMDAYLRYAEHAPFHDPGPLVAIMAAATRRIGLAATLPTTFYPPFLLARLMTTLDHLSRGRIAWNVVTSYKIEEALNGFAIRQGIWPGYVGPFVEKVIPLLQQRGAVRTEYTGTTLREHLREF